MTPLGDKDISDFLDIAKLGDSDAADGSSRHRENE